METTGKKESIFEAPLDDKSLDKNGMFMLSQRAGGKVIQTMIKLDKEGQNKLDIFQVYGLIRIKRLMITAMNVQDSTTLSGVKITLAYDQGAVDVCAATDLSGLVQGSAVILSGKTNEQLTVLSASNPVAINTDFQSVSLMQKPDMQKPTKLVIEYTGDANTNVDLDIYVEFDSFAGGLSFMPQQ